MDYREVRGALVRGRESLYSTNPWFKMQVDSLAHFCDTVVEGFEAASKEKDADYQERLRLALSGSAFSQLVPPDGGSTT